MLHKRAKLLKAKAFWLLHGLHCATLLPRIGLQLVLAVIRQQMLDDI